MPVGTTAYTVTVNGSTTTVNVTRAADGTPDATKTLASLQVSGSILTFVSTTFSYDVVIPYITEVVTVTATPSSRFAGLEYLDNNDKRISNQNIALEENVEKLVKVRVIAEDKAAGYQDYTLNLTRAEGNTNANLSSIEVFLGDDIFENVLEDEFSKFVTEYTLNVPNSVSKATVKGAKEEQYLGEYVEGEGPNYINANLNVGNNEFKITVKPEKGPSKTYTVTIVRAAEVPSSSSSEVPSSSSAEVPSSSSAGDITRLIAPQVAAGPIRIYTAANTIILENLPSSAKVEIYNLRGELVHSSTSHSPLATSHIKVQTKGIYIIKVNNQVLRIPVR